MNKEPAAKKENRNQAAKQLFLDDLSCFDSSFPANFDTSHHFLGYPWPRLLGQAHAHIYSYEN